MQKFNVSVYLVNTGWVGANAQSGAKRFSLPATRKILTSILNGDIENSEFQTDLYFGIKIPKTLSGIEPNVLNPQTAWKNLDEYHQSAKNLVKKFQENYKKYDLGDEKILKAGPTITD